MADRRHSETGGRKRDRITAAVIERKHESAERGLFFSS